MLIEKLREILKDVPNDYVMSCTDYNITVALEHIDDALFVRNAEFREIEMGNVEVDEGYSKITVLDFFKYIEENNIDNKAQLFSFDFKNNCPISPEIMIIKDKKLVLLYFV